MSEFYDLLNYWYCIIQIIYDNNLEKKNDVQPTVRLKDIRIIVDADPIAIHGAL